MPLEADSFVKEVKDIFTIPGKFLKDTMMVFIATPDSY